MSESVWVIKEIRRDTIALSIAIAVFLVASYEILGRNAFDEATLRLSTSYALVAGVSATLMGFLLTALSILIVLPQRGRLEITDQKSMKLLYNVFLLAIYVELSVFVLSTVGAVLGTRFFLLAIFVMIALLYSVILLVRVLMTFRKVLGLGEW